MRCLRRTRRRRRTKRKSGPPSKIHSPDGIWTEARRRAKLYKCNVINSRLSASFVSVGAVVGRTVSPIIRPQKSRNKALPSFQMSALAVEIAFLAVEKCPKTTRDPSKCPSLPSKYPSNPSGDPS